MPQQLELGLDTFGDVTAGADGKLLSHAQVIRRISSRRPCSPTRSEWTSWASASTTAGTLRSLPRSPPRRNRWTHTTDPARLLRNGLELG